MSSAAPRAGSPPDSRWTDGSMDSLVRRRYAAERRFRYLGFAAVAVSALFLALPAVHHGVEGPWRLHRHRSRRDDRFPALRPDARPGRACRAAGRAGGCRHRPVGAAVAGRGRSSSARPARKCSPAARCAHWSGSCSPTRSCLSKRTTLWLPVASKVDVAAKGEGTQRQRGAGRTRSSSGAASGARSTPAS